MEYEDGKESVSLVSEKKKSKVLLGLGICLILLGIGIFLMYFNNAKDILPIDFVSATNEDDYSQIDVQFMTYSINDIYDSYTYHIVGDGEYFYIVKVDFDDWDKLATIREYTYSDGSYRPDPITIYGMPVPFDDDLIYQTISKYSDLGMSGELTYSNFNDYFGSYYLDATKSPLSSSLTLYMFIVCIVITIGIFLITKYLQKEKMLPFTVLLLILSWIVLFAINIPDDFETTPLVVTGFYFVILSTGMFIYAILKRKKNEDNGNEVQNAALVHQKNEYENLDSEKILASIHDKYEEFKQKCGVTIIFIGGWNSAISDNASDEEVTKYLEYSIDDFTTSLFIKLLLNSTEEEMKKTKKFLRNINEEIYEVLENATKFDKEKIKSYLKEHDAEGDLANANFDAWRKAAFNLYTKIENVNADKSKFSLKQEEWNQFLADVENAYRAYVGPQNSIDLLGQYGKTSVENANSASNISLFAFWLPLFLIIAMVIKFFMELLGEEGIVLSGGWWSLGFFVVLIIWVSIGNSGRYCTCANCHKWNSLKLDGDYIIDSRDTWKTKKYYENGRNYSKQVPIRVEKHEEHYTCEHCGNKEIKYRTTEREL